MSRPGILRVFWPAFLGWGAFAAHVALALIRSQTDAIPAWLEWLGLQACLSAMLVAPLGAILVVRRLEEARRGLPLWLNLSTYIPFLAILLNGAMWVFLRPIS